MRKLRWFCIICTLMLAAQAHAVPHDKVGHTKVEFLIGTAVGSVVQDKAWAFSISMVPGVGKELYDLRHPKSHKAEWGDLAADAVGAGLGVYFGRCILIERHVLCRLEF